MPRRIAFLAGLVIATALPSAFAQVPKQATQESESPQPNRPFKGSKVVKTDQEWSKLLTQDQFLVTRRKATEPAFTGKLLHNKGKGVYTCVCCDSPLFLSKTKFDSGTGWPSFYAPYTQRSVAEEVDNSYGQTRVEVVCATCDAHLGHVFDDGPLPTGMRYCMNSAALKFVKDPTAPTKATKKTNPASKKGETAGATSTETTPPPGN